MTRNSEMPILSGGWNSRQFVFQKLSGLALKSLECHVMKLGSEAKIKVAMTALKILDYVLRIIGHQELNNIIQLRSNKFNKVQRYWIGAIYSPKFNQFSESRRACLANAAMSILLKLSEQYHIEIVSRSFKWDGIYGEGVSWVKEFEATPYIPEVEACLRGWKIFNRRGVESLSIFLEPILNNFGVEFTEAFYLAVQAHAGKRSSCGALARVVNTLSKVVQNIDSLNAEYKKLVEIPLTKQALQNSEYVTEFLWLLHDYHFTRYQVKKEEGILDSFAALSDYQRDWMHFVKLITDALIPANIIAKPLGNIFPEGKPLLSKFRDQANYRKSDGGNLISTKLMTNVPLQVTDEEAMQILFCQIQNDVDSVKKWAKSEIESMYQRYQNSKKLQAEGEIVPFRGSHHMIERDNPRALENVIRTIRETYGGYVVCKHSTRKTYCHLFGQTMRAGRVVHKGLIPKHVSYHLGILTDYDLIIYAIYLIILHPILTEAPLLTCELFKKDGTRTGLQETDGGYKLTVFKGRKGSHQAQQDIQLTDESAAIVNQIVELTSPLREYLKKNNDDRWRRLFLFIGSKSGFGEPKVFEYDSDTNAVLRTLNNSRNGQPALTLGKVWRKLTLTRLRASVGVLVYIKTRSIDKMSEALGNTNHVVLKHYLPEAILAFFQERWIRLFQNGIIVHALKDSRFLLEASDFSTMDEVNEFLKNHAFHNMPALEEPTFEISSDRINDAKIVKCNESASSLLSTNNENSDEILIKIEVGILTLLMGIKTAVNNACERKICPKAIFWSEFAGEIERHIESDSFRDPFILRALADAKKIVNSNPLVDFIYV